MIRQRFYILFFIPMLTACLESPEMTIGIVNGKEMPTVLTENENPFHSDGYLFFQGKIMSEGKGEIFERGFCWSIDSNSPTMDDNIVISTGDTDVFSYELENISGDTIYYWRAFARNIHGYDYGKVQSCRTPKIWEAKEPLNAWSRGRGAVFTLNDKIYMTCGEYSGSGRIPVNETWEYSITSNRWRQTASFAGDYRIDPVVFTIGNFAFVGTGRNGAGTHKDFYQYDITLDKWTKIDTPGDLEAGYQAVAFSLNGKGYVIGGFSPRGRFNDVWQYNADNGFWKRMGNFPVDFYGGISISDNNQVFAGFGITSESARILWKYDEENDSWSEFVKLSDEVVKSIYSGVIIRNTIYIVDENNTIWACDISRETKTWTKKADLPSEFFNEFGEVINQQLLTIDNSNSIYVGLGDSNFLYEYRPLWNN